MKKKSIVKFFVTVCFVACIMLTCSTTASAHREWKKMTKLPDGKYTIDYDYYNIKYWWKDVIKLKIKGNTLTLNCAVKKIKGPVYCSDPLKLKISKKCKYTLNGALGKKKVSKKAFLTELKTVNKEEKGLYECLKYFKVKNNKICYINMDYYY